MSLLGNRGRFSKDKNHLFGNNHSDNESEISLIGKNPTSFFNSTNDLKSDAYNKNNKNINSEYKVNNKNNSLIKKFTSHQEYNKSLKDYYNDTNENKTKNLHGTLSNFKIGKKLIIAMIFVEVFTLFGIYFVGSIYRMTKAVQPITINKKNIENTNISKDTIEIMKGFKTVAVFGVDSRTGSVDKGNNADVNMIINVDFESKKVQLISLYRDLYLSVTKDNLYDKLNSAYRRGGPEQAIDTINKNFDLNIENYFSFSWKSVADGIELIGGIDLDISKAEFAYLNAFIHETCIATGIDAKNPAAHYIKKSGMQHLDGVQAVAYGRLRLMDSDFQRVERQKKVIALCLNKAKTLDIPKLRLIIEAVLPQIAYEFDMNDIFSLLNLVRYVNITESAGCPEVNNVVAMNMGASGECIVPINLEKAVIQLHKILFNAENYNPSNAVKRYSNRIKELKAKYIEENKTMESLRESINSDEDEIVDSDSSDGEQKKGTVSAKNTRRTVASQSNANKTKKEEVTAPNNLNIVDADNYQEEPEEDSEVKVFEVPDAPSGQIDSPSFNNNAPVVISGPPGSVDETIDAPSPTSVGMPLPVPAFSAPY